MFGRGLRNGKTMETIITGFREWASHGNYRLGFRASGFRVYWINVRDPFYFLGYGIPYI